MNFYHIYIICTYRYRFVMLNCISYNFFTGINHLDYIVYINSF